MSKRFTRTDVNRHIKLGRNRRVKAWRRARGRHSKIRKKRRGYPIMPTVGYMTARKESGKVKGYYPVMINNLKDLNTIQKNSAGIIASKVGAKKRLDIVKKAEEMKIKILNLGGAK